ncbi:AAA family ATPase [Actinocrispum sp. NPDC049592]|uniref:helix-turn-helix transcriptional regulator n=1 Tax=Actinocrispum sp. NPDC049592 TaxID=3154835 RepID=UPI003438AB17
MPRIGSGIALVGRGAELDALRSALAAADSGQAGAVLLAGDAGVGKSRLLAELVTTARSTGVTVFTGRCLDVDEAGLPYLPFVEALGQLGEAQRDVARNRPVLNRLVPGLGSVAGPSEDQAMEQLRLFDSVHGLFSDLAATGCVLLALEDLHWADASTRDLILFLMSRLRNQRLLIVCTYRTDDLHRRHPLRPLLGELSRLPTVDQIQLSPFSPSDAVEFVSALSDGSLPASTVRKIAERSEGNAFFCEELTAVYGDGAGVPSGLAELLLARVERLSAAARAVVRAASVASTTVTHSSLAAVSSLSSEVLEEALREAVQLNVLVTSDGGYTFRHALLREAVYGDLLPGERVRLHAGYASIVTSQALLAYHSLRAHDLPRALDASIRAARVAADMGAPGELLRHLEQALELLGAVGSESVDELELFRNAASAAAATGETERAVKYAQTVVDLSDAIGDPEQAAEARVQLVAVSMPWEHRTMATQSIVEAAWDLVRARPPSATKAKVLALLARQWVWDWAVDVSVDELRAYTEEAITIAKQVGAAAVEVDALVTLAVFAEWTNHVDEAIQVGRLAAERAASIGAYDVELRARKNTSISLLLAGRLDEALRLVEFVRKRAAEVGMPWGAAAVDAGMEVVHIRYLMGEWAAALESVDTAGAPPMVTARIMSPAMHILAAQGEFAQVEALAAELERLTTDGLAHAVGGFAMAEAAQWQGRYREAVDHVERVFGHLESLSRPSLTDAAMAAATGISALADLASAGSPRAPLVAEGEALLARMADHTPRTHVGELVYQQTTPMLAMHRARVAAEVSRLRGVDSPALWAEAVATAEGFGYPSTLARWRWAGSLLAAGSREEGAEQLEIAYSRAASLGAVPLRDALVGLARRARVSLPGVAAPSDDVLTPRELAVLELVARGLTNRQVGDRLYISQKTASVHLSRVMAKLGAANRTEVVSIAHDRGLLA